MRTKKKPRMKRRRMTRLEKAAKRVKVNL